MIEIVFLGTGAGIPTPRRNLSGIWLRYEGDVFLFDCAEGTQRQMFSGKLNFMKIDHIFISHWHADHWAGLIGLIQTMNLEKRRKPLRIYGPEADKFVPAILALGYWAPRFSVIPVNVPFEGKEETPVLETKEYSIVSLAMKHTVPAVGYYFKEKDRINVDIKKAEKRFGLKQGPLVGKLKKHKKVVVKGKTITLDDVSVVKKGKKIAYTGDTGYSQNVIALAQNADLLINDATFLEKERDTKTHCSAKEAAQIAQKAKVKKLVINHFSRRYLDTKPLVDEAKDIFPHTIASKDFLKLTLK